MKFLLLLLLAVVPLAAEDHDHHHAETTPVGTATVEGKSLAVASVGKPVPGTPWFVEVRLAKDQARPKAIRLWVGSADGKGALKTKAARHHGAYEGQVDVPKPLPEGAALWISLEAADGTSTSGSVALPKP